MFLKRRLSCCLRWRASKLSAKQSDQTRIEQYANHELQVEINMNFSLLIFLIIYTPFRTNHIKVFFIEQAVEEQPCNRKMSDIRNMFDARNTFVCRLCIALKRIQNDIYIYIYICIILNIVIYIYIYIVIYT